MKFNKNKFKANLNHIWTFYKRNSLIYASLGVFLLLIYLGGRIIKLQIVLPDYLLSGLVVILLGFVFLNSIMSIEEREQRRKRWVEWAKTEAAN
jgi:hypothetical protein